MYRILKELSFAAGHFIRGHAGECRHPHGHNYRVRLHLETAELDALGMVADFADVKAMLRDIVSPLDHRMINEVPPFTERNTTAELIAEFVFREAERRLGPGRVRVARVEVWENDTSCAVFEAGS
jgi:6-pyruvoyltetrahydropterin/6-carboxytetrahydropterin synthase